MRRKDREIEDREALSSILEKADACHLAFAVGDMPYIVTMNFGWEWQGEYPVLYFHCAREGRKLEMMRRNPRVCFELDVGHELVTGSVPCDWGMKYSSVVGYGILGEIPDDAGRLAGLDRVMRHYGWSGGVDYRSGTLDTTTVLSLKIDELSGKRKM
jgi:nitroimidazol reductase NimA-like FMN-containing flavoprotein (pyridoxamine 5'-phosphate oxidase superfamily)